MLQGAGNYYRPLFEFWLLINHSIFGLNAWGWHLTSLAVHLAVVGLTYLLAQKVTGDRLTAAIATLLFAVHPTHIESVAWISGITDPLCALFALAGLLAYIRSREEASTGWMLGAIGLYAAAMLSKETAIVTPALIFGFDWLIRKESLGTSAKHVGPLAATGIAYLLVRHFVLRGFLHAENYSFVTVALTLPEVAWFYVRQLLWPFRLSVFYDTRFVEKIGAGNLLLPLLGVALFTTAIVWLARRSRAAAWSAGTLVLFLLPALAGIYVFIPEELVHDRYLYLPSLGFAMLVAIGIRKLRADGELLGGPRLQMAVALVLGAVFAATTATQNAYWANDLILYAHGVNVAPNNVVAIDHLANEFYKRKKSNEAIALYERAVKTNPKSWHTRFAMGITLFELGDYQKASEQLQAAKQIAPDAPEQFYFLGLAELQLGNATQAEQELQKAKSFNPTRPGVNFALGLALKKQGRIEDAKKAFRSELNLYPNDAAAAELAKLDGK